MKGRLKQSYASHEEIWKGNVALAGRWTTRASWRAPARCGRSSVMGSSSSADHHFGGSKWLIGFPRYQKLWTLFWAEISYFQFKWPWMDRRQKVNPYRKKKARMCFKPSGEPHAVYQGSYLVPIMVRLFCLASSAVETLNMPFKAEALAIPTSARLDRISEFLRSGPVTFDTLVLHTGSGDIVPLSTYFNRQGFNLAMSLPLSTFKQCPILCQLHQALDQAGWA